MGPDDLLLIVMITALTLYAILGGADFGAGVWEFTTALQASEKERARIYKAIGPVWEANHVWLIFVLVMGAAAACACRHRLSRRKLRIPVLRAR